jgi:hypothetical protein
MCEGDDHKDKHQHKCFYTHTHAQAHMPLLRCYNMLLLHTSIHAFSHKCCFTPTHTHTHTPVHTQAFTHMSYTYAFTCMLFHTCCCTHAAYICLHRHPFTNTVRHALLHEHSCTPALLHKPLHPHMLCLFSAKRRAREEKSQSCRSLRKGDNHN